MILGSHGRGLLPTMRPLARTPAEEHADIAAALKALKGSGDLTALTPRVLDQRQHQMCWAFSATMLKYTRESAKGILPALSSPLFFAQAVYGMYRDQLTPPGQALPLLSDGGADLDFAVTAFSKWGAVPFQAGANDDTDVPENSQLPEADAEMFVAASNGLFGGPYEIAPTGNAPALAAAAIDAQIPVWIGALVGQAFEALMPGQVAKPCPKTDPYAGGHAMAIIGYRTAGSSLEFLLRNSWSTGWGDGGNIWASAEFISTAWSLLPFEVYP